MSNTSPRIVVIEKDHLIQNLLRDILESDGYRVLVTDRWLDPEDVRQLRPTAMLLDPFVDGEPQGWDYVRRLRAQPGMQRLPIVVCTADHELLRDITAEELALASTVILKPFDLDELLETVQIAITPVRITEPLPWPVTNRASSPNGSD